MQPIQKRHGLFLTMLICVQVVLCFVILLFLFTWGKDISGHTSSTLREGALRMSKEKLQRRVDHIFAHITREEKGFTRKMHKFVKFIADTLPQGDFKYLQGYFDKWMPALLRTEDGRHVSVLLHDPDEQRTILYNNMGAIDISDKYNGQDFQDFITKKPIFQVVRRGDVQICFFVDEEAIHSGVKQALYQIIHSSFYGEDGYVWVNEVLNFQGGEQYAVRVIHPNLQETEGQYLSTAITNIGGKRPYLTELEGIKQNGEIFHTYFFKNLSNGEIAEKASYARLYKPFNWIIATGDPLEQIYVHADELADHSARTLKKALHHLSLGLLAIFAMALFIIVLAAMLYRKNVNALFHTETRLDPLTAACNRKAAEEMLEQAFKQRKVPGADALVMILDIDNFKQINDTYGHDMGDTVLKCVVQAIQGNIRATDRLARWGGEEFLLLLKGIKDENTAQVGEKILQCIRHLKFDYGDTSFGISISMGSSPFFENDNNFGQAVTRADQALYHSKHNGKDRHTDWKNIPQV